MATLYLPDAVYARGELRFGEELAVSDEGLVVARETVGAQPRRVALPGRVLLPGLVNAHSHAFQRVLRGRTEYLALGRPQEDFWTWREAMYGAAAGLSPEELYVVSRQAFLEMALAGITTVGEFHYLHHGPDGAPYADRQELALQVLRAASDVGLRLVLLRAVYARGGYGVQVEARQRRFLDPDVDTALQAANELRARAPAAGLCTVGLAPHSVRALPSAWLAAIAEAWREGPLHVHAAEQLAEVRACVAEHGLGPVALLDEVGLLRPGTTLVHAIHLEPGDVERLVRARAAVCACPSTERNLGDGVIAADQLAQAGVPLCLGSDSQAQIDLLDEARLLEGHLRLTRQRRNVLAPPSTDPSALAARLLDLATAGGAASLGLPVGALEPGRPADFLTVDRNHPSLVGLTAATLLAGLVFAATTSAVREVAVQGRLLVEGGALARPPGPAHTSAYASIVARLSG